MCELMPAPTDPIDAIYELEQQGVDAADIRRRVWAQFGCTRAALVLDSTGFTRVTHAQGIVHYLALLGRLRELLHPVLEAHNCLRLRAETDNLYAEFADPERALDAAIAANEAVFDSGLMLNGSEPFGVCIGIGYGKMLLSEREGLFGAEMNLASKLGEDIAQFREILLTAAAYEALPPQRRSGFEERFSGISGNAVSYHWMHWARATKG